MNFFSKIEAQKLDQQTKQQESAVIDKLEKVKVDQQRRIDSLQEAYENNQYKAKLITDNIEDVDKAIKIVGSYISNAVPWEQLNAVIKEEKKKGNPIASIIHRLKLETNEIVLLLSKSNAMTEEEITAESEQVDIDIGETAYANATKYFEMMKKSEFKKQKTEDAAEQAFKAAEKKS